MDFKAEYAEYKDLSDNMRHYANMYFAQLTLFVILTGGLFQLSFNTDNSLFERKILFDIIGVFLGFVFFILDKRVDDHWRYFEDRAKFLEGRLDFLQYINRPIKKRPFTHFFARRAIFFAAILLWSFAIIWHCLTCQGIHAFQTLKEGIEKMDFGIWGLIVQFATLGVVLLYTYATFKLAKTANDSLRVSTLPLLNYEVVDFIINTNQGIGRFKNSNLRPAFFWIEVRGYRIQNPEDHLRNANELQRLHRNPDAHGFYDGSQRQFFAPGDQINGWFTLDEIGEALRAGQGALIEVSLWVTGDDKVIKRDNPRVLAYPPTRWLLDPNQPQQRVTRIV